MPSSPKTRPTGTPREPRSSPTARRPRDADATRELLLTTAEEAFTSSGFDGARVDDIAERARVNKRMIYVYFGDKEGLYASVLRRAFARIARRAKVNEIPDVDPAERLRRWIHDYFCFLGRQPELVRLAEWEALADGSRAASALLEVAQQELVDLTALLNAGVTAGRFRADLKPEQALMAIHGLCFGTLSRRRLWNSLWQLDLDEPSVLDSTAEFLAEVVLGGIGVRSTADPLTRSTSA
ncbi:MAG TPA: TetR/AcrR family transcriptional regulator [Polyangiaceae bacterium]|nr:TetR/AcrR family transcriptional regulator [Polyangiaceae bacterium]